MGVDLYLYTEIPKMAIFLIQNGGVNLPVHIVTSLVEI